MALWLLLGYLCLLPPHSRPQDCCPSDDPSGESEEEEGPNGTALAVSQKGSLERWVQPLTNSSFDRIKGFPWPLKRVAQVDGDIVLGALMMVHEREDSLICGPIMPQGGIQALECMLYTLDWVNQRDLVPGIRLGAHVLDDCDKDTYGLEQAVDFIKGSITNLDEGSYKCPDGSSPSIRHKPVWGVLGAASSVTSIQVANLLRLFRIPQVSFFSTSPELSNKQRFEFFLRTVPSDTNQAQAMVEIVRALNWTYLSILFEESNYGIQAFTVLEELLSRHHICIAVKERLTKDSGVAAEAAYDAIVKKLLSKQRARGVIIFGSDQEVAGVMRAVRRGNATGLFSWVGSDGWSARSLVSEGNEEQVEGTLSVQPRARPVEGFDTYFRALDPRNNTRNPWFVEYWEQAFRCRWPGAALTPYNGVSLIGCTGAERPYRPLELERQLAFVSDSVLVFAHALRKMHSDLCSGRPGLCLAMESANGTLLLAYLRDVSFTGLSGDSFRFSSQGDGPARYDVLHFRRESDGSFRWMTVGEYSEGNLRLDMTQVRFRSEEPLMPASVCSLPCLSGQARKYVDGERCCWHCFNCSKYQVPGGPESQCLECGPGYLPGGPTGRDCVSIPIASMRPDSSWSAGAMALAFTGVLLTSCVILVFARFNDTPVVRASGRELSYVLLGGILLCYAMTGVLVQRPSALVCGAQRLGLGLCFSIVYGALLTKTDRIARIFRAGRRTTRRPRLISPRAQLGLCAALVGVQLGVSCAWLFAAPPRAVLRHPTRETVHLVCEGAADAAGYAAAFAYPILLIATCTVYAVLTRKIPEAFNESKHIGFAMYTTCVLWLAFVPMYFTTSGHPELNSAITCLTVSLSASASLVCLYAPKLYIILGRPEKNVRQSLMQGAKYGALPSAATASSIRADTSAHSQLTVELSGGLSPQQREDTMATLCLTPLTPVQSPASPTTQNVATQTDPTEEPIQS